MKLQFISGQPDRGAVGLSAEACQQLRAVLVEDARWFLANPGATVRRRPPHPAEVRWGGMSPTTTVAVRYEDEVVTVVDEGVSPPPGMTEQQSRDLLIQAVKEEPKPR